MSAYNFTSLMAHVGHQVEVVTYEDLYGIPINVSIECLDCNEVLLDYDDVEDEEEEND